MIQHSPECVKVHLTGGIRSSRHIGADNHPIIARALELWLNRFPDLSDYLLTLEMDRWNHETVSWFQPGVSPQTYISQMIGGMADLHVLPAIARVQDVFEILTIGPGTTHTRGEDALGFEVLAQLRTNGLADIHTPSAHFYADKGWKKLDRRMAEVERRFREMGWDRAVASETGCHGHYVQGLDGFRWPWQSTPPPSDQVQVDRTGYLKARLDLSTFWTESYWFQITEDTPAWFGIFASDWRLKPVSEFWA